jgi:hypothetical protein
VNRIDKLNSDIEKFVKELEVRLYQEFHEDYFMWDSIIDIYINVNKYNKIDSLYIAMVDYREAGFFRYNEEKKYWFYDGKEMDQNFVETTLEVLNWHEVEDRPTIKIDTKKTGNGLQK